ncbi:hypothetical protein LZ023_37640 (plasmid) [Pseudomonas silvicola]|nr:hypothetical protein LZ023_37640 [Pseudomonas silvicola]
MLWAPSYLMQVKNLSIGTAGTIASLLGITGALGGAGIGATATRAISNVVAPF